MEIKRIQLRGISRNPSDRMTEDGGVAESLNTYMSGGEVAVVNAPTPYDEKVDAELPPNCEVVYMHKTSISENRILYFRELGRLGLLVNLNPLQYSFVAYAPSLKKITHVGNTLVVVSDEGIRYALFKDGIYTPIDLDEERFPKLSFVNVNQPAGAFEGAIYDIWNYDSYDPGFKGHINGNPEMDYLVEDEDKKQVLTTMWEKYRRMVDNNLARGCFSEPVMVRYAIKLYDGSYIWASSPIMLGASLPKCKSTVFPFNIDNDETPVTIYTASKDSDYKTYIQLADPFKIGVNIFSRKDFSSLKDIVTSVDVFLSNTINFYPEGNKKVRGGVVRGLTPDDYYTTCYQYIFDPSYSENAEKIEEVVTSTSTFYLAKSYKIDELPTEMDVLSDNFLGEVLYTKTRLDDTKVTTPITFAKDALAYNGRLIAAGVDEKFSRGLGVLNGQCANYQELTNASNLSYAFVFHIPTSNITTKDHDAKSEEISYLISSDMGRGSTELGKVTDLPCTPYAWISHPNPNCTEVSVRIFENGVEMYGRDIEMKPHPYLNCSYAFLGIGEKIFTRTASAYDLSYYRDDEPIVRKRNMVAFSSSSNPFVFPLAGKTTFGGDLNGLAIAADPMSTGQFGQYPIYYFLEDGVWTTAISADGNVGSAPTMVTRDACTNPSTIAMASKAVFFMSKRGLMALSGSQAECISENMFGSAFSMPGAAVPIIKGAGFDNLAEATNGVDSFMTFMNLHNSAIAFDYEGQRLICFNKDRDYQYVYSMLSNTWHRTQYGKLSTPLNVYPRCVVTSKDEDGKYRLMDIGLVRDMSHAPMKALIATRPFDLGEPDILKTIKDVRVRGQFARGAVKFILQGSQDNIHWYTISTLRGKSWKLFRLIILADLDATDRISWVDVGYETRFTNKLR